MRTNKRLWIVGVLTLVLCTYFWTQSRYPALAKKMAVGPQAKIVGLSFDVVRDPASETSALGHIAANFVNWCFTNWKGMVFGILLASLILTLLNQLRVPRFGNPWLNTLMGAGVGAPLGLCANCATPVGIGLSSGGAPRESTLAIIISSPTLNFMCLWMVFAFFPPAFALTKVALTLGVLSLIPLVVSQGAMQGVRSSASGSVVGGAASSFSANESWSAATRETFKAITLNLWKIVKHAIPFMLLAGLLGAIAIEIVPTNWIVGVQPSLVNIAAAALFGAFVPVPMAFDVIFAYVLLLAGAAPGLVMAMLFTLGIFSVYPMLVIWRNMSARTALSMLALVTFAGTLAGFGMQMFLTQ